MMSINELGFVHGFVKSFTSDILNTNNYTLKMVCSKKKNPKQNKNKQTKTNFTCFFFQTMHDNLIICY